MWRFILEVIILFPYLYSLKVTAHDFYFDGVESRDTATEQLSNLGQATATLLLWASRSSLEEEKILC